MERRECDSPTLSLVSCIIASTTKDQSRFDALTLYSIQTSYTYGDLHALERESNACCGAIATSYHLETSLGMHQHFSIVVLCRRPIHYIVQRLPKLL